MQLDNYFLEIKFVKLFSSLKKIFLFWDPALVSVPIDKPVVFSFSNLFKKFFFDVALLWRLAGCFLYIQ